MVMRWIYKYAIPVQTRVVVRTISVISILVKGEKFHQKTLIW